MFRSKTFITIIFLVSWLSRVSLDCKCKVLSSVWSFSHLHALVCLKWIKCLSFRFILNDFLGFLLDRPSLSAVMCVFVCVYGCSNLLVFTLAHNLVLKSWNLLNIVAAVCVLLLIFCSSSHGSSWICFLSWICESHVASHACGVCLSVPSLLRCVKGSHVRGSGRSAATLTAGFLR